MFITRKHLSRRTFLRGGGATIGLPFLSAMVPAATALADLACDFLAGLAEQDPAAAALFRGGLHAGPVIGSLLASPRPRFDLWGEAVDTARSVAELADPGSVLVTPPARSLLDEDIALDSIGVRDVGTRGSMRLHRLKDRTAA